MRDYFAQEGKKRREYLDIREMCAYSTRGSPCSRCPSHPIDGVLVIRFSIPKSSLPPFFGPWFAPTGLSLSRERLMRKGSTKKDRKSERYARWRRAVFRRDGYRCRTCGARAKIEAHHVRP